MPRAFPWPRNRWGELEPPHWLRHLVPWWLLSWISDRYLVCWSGMVSWKIFGDGAWNLQRGCFWPYDYCGKYDGLGRNESSDEARKTS